MFEARLKKVLKPDEEVISIIKKYFIVFIVPLLISAVFIIASFFFLYPLFHMGWWGVLIFFILLLIGILSALRVLIIYSYNVFIITDHRIIDIDQKGFFERTVSETNFEKIQDVSFHIKGILPTFLHYGSIIIQTAGQQANIELSNVKNPGKVQQTIIELQHQRSEKEKNNKHDS